MRSGSSTSACPGVQAFATVVSGQFGWYELALGAALSLAWGLLAASNKPRAISEKIKAFGGRAEDVGDVYQIIKVKFCCAKVAIGTLACAVYAGVARAAAEEFNPCAFANVEGSTIRAGIVGQAHVLGSTC